MKQNITIALALFCLGLFQNNSQAETIGTITPEVQVASTNRVKEGYFGCVPCEPIPKIYKKKTNTHSYEYSSDTGYGYSTTSFFYSETYEYDGGTPVSCEGTYYREVGGGGSTNSWSASLLSDCINWDNPEVLYFENLAYQASWSVQDGCNNTLFSSYQVIPDPEDPSPTTENGLNIVATSVDEEITTDSLLDLDGVPFSDWRPGSGTAFIKLDEDEMAGEAAAMNWRIKFIAEPDEPVEFSFKLVYRSDCTNFVIGEYKVNEIGTGAVQYYPSEGGESVEPPKFGPVGDCSPCATYMNGSISIVMDGDCEHEGGGGGCNSGCAGPPVPGNPNFDNRSVQYMASLGQGDYGKQHGELVLYSKTPDVLLSTPAKLEYFGNFTDVEVINSNSVLRQVKAPQCLADVEPINADKYEIRFYHTAGTKDENGFYSSPSGLFSTHTVEHVGGSTNHLRITADNGAVSVANYTWSDAERGWTLATGDATDVLRKESVTWDATALIKTNIVRNPDDSLVYKEVKTYVELAPLGRVVSEKVVDPDGDALVTQKFYYDNPTVDGTNYARLRLQIDPSGFWTRYEYSTNNGHVTKEVRQFLNAATNAADNLCRVIEYDESIIADAIESKTTVEKLLGVEIGRSYHLEFFGEHHDIQCQTPGAAWDAADNLVTISKYYTNGPFTLDLQSVLHPNGTMDIYEYSTNATERITTVYSGKPDINGEEIVDGTKTVTTTDLFGNPVLMVQSDIVSETMIGYQIHSNADQFGRPQSTSYLDGTTHKSYSCCGVSSTTDKAGTITSYTYDGLRRLLTTTASSITVSNVYDAAHNVLARVRIGTDDSEIFLGGTDLDVALRPIYQTNALLYVTTNRYGYNGSGETVTTNLYPDGGIQIATSAQDGSLLSVTGSAVHPVRYEYGVEWAGTNASGVNVTNFYTKEIKLNTNGTDTAEWKKGYVDMLGRNWKTVYANGGIAYSFYNNQGQLVKTVDPDGVIKLLAYNDLGELEFSAVDLNQDGAMSLLVDRVTKTIRDVTEAHGFEVLRTRTYVYPLDSDDTPLLLSTMETSTDGLRQWSTSHGVTQRSETSYPGSGQRTMTRYAADDSYAVTAYLDGRVTSVTHYDSGSSQLQQTTYEYDEHGRRETVTDARNGATTYTFNNADQVLTVTTPVPGTGLSAQTTTYEYDQRGRVKKTIQPDSGEVFNQYYSSGELKKTYGSRTYPVEYTYDSQGRMKTMKTWQNFATSQGAAITTWNYDAERGFLTSKLYADSKGTTYTNSLAGRLLSRTWDRGISAVYGYNEAGDLETVDYSDATPDITYTYDRQGRKTVAEQGGTTTEFLYNDAGQLLSETYIGGPLDGVVVTNMYDTSLRRTNLMAEVSSTPFLQHSYAYGPASRLSIVSDGTNSATYGYLANSPLVETITFKENTTERMVTDKVYDNLNRLTSITHSSNSVALAEYVYKYNDANQRVRVDEVDDSYWIYEYDALGQVKSGKKYWSDGTPVAGQQFVYSHDDIGNRKHAASGGNEWGTGLRYAHYNVNSVNQYTSRTVPGAVDVIGTANTSSTVTVNNQPTYRKGEYFWGKLSIGNQSSPIYQSITNLAVLNDFPDPDITTNSTGNVLLPKTPETFLHDSDGNLIRDGLWTNIWNGENRLVRTESLSTVPEAARARVDWTHLPDGRWIERVVSIWVSGAYVPQSTNRFVWDGQVLLGILDENNAATLSFMRGLDLSGTMQDAGGVGGLLAVTDHSTSETHLVGNDGNGNITLLVNAADGVESAQYSYSPFGETIRATGEMAKMNPIRFSTQFADDVTGDAKYLFREYRTTTGRWLSKDPIGEKGGLNVYGFLKNDGISHIDRFGYNIFSSLQDLYNNVGQGLNQIGQAVDNLSNHANEIGNAVEAVTGIAGQIGEALGNLGNAVNEIADPIANLIKNAKSYELRLRGSVSIDRVNKERAGNCKMCCCPPVPNWLLKKAIQNRVDAGLKQYESVGVANPPILVEFPIDLTGSSTIYLPIDPYGNPFPEKPTCTLNVTFTADLKALLRIGS